MTKEKRVGRKKGEEGEELRCYLRKSIHMSLLKSD